MDHSWVEELVGWGGGGGLGGGAGGGRFWVCRRHRQLFIAAVVNSSRPFSTEPNTNSTAECLQGTDTHTHVSVSLKQAWCCSDQSGNIPSFKGSHTFILDLAQEPF